MCAPDFAHDTAANLPVIGAKGASVRLIAGWLFGARSPVPTAHETIYADIGMNADVRLLIDVAYEERTLYIDEGTIEIAGDRLAPGRLWVPRPGGAFTVRAIEPARLMLLAGAPIDGPRHILWNFVSWKNERRESARSTGKPADSCRCPARSSTSRSSTLIDAAPHRH